MIKDLSLIIKNNKIKLKLYSKNLSLLKMSTNLNRDENCYNVNKKSFLIYKRLHFIGLQNDMQKDDRAQSALYKKNNIKNEIERQFRNIKQDFYLHQSKRNKEIYESEYLSKTELYSYNMGVLNSNEEINKAMQIKKVIIQEIPNKHSTDLTYDGIPEVKLKHFQIKRTTNQNSKTNNYKLTSKNNITKTPISNHPLVILRAPQNELPVTNPSGKFSKRISFNKRSFLADFPLIIINFEGVIAEDRKSVV